MILNNLTLPQKVFDTLLGIKQDVLNVSGKTIALQTDKELLDIRLKKLASLIYAEALDASTGNVDYIRLKDSQAYKEYQQLTRQLPLFDLSTLVRREQKLAFWLNLYNALVIDGIIYHGIGKTVNEMIGFFRHTAYNIGDYRFCLDDIEHGILRANAGHLLIPGPQFVKDDPRRAFVLNRIDYRIHFALVCGAVSCPPINFYDAENIDAQLDLATQNFLEENVEVDTHDSVIRLSKLLQWYSEDFGTGTWVKLGLGDKSPLLQTIMPYITDDKKRTVINDASKSTKIHFKSYNWALNTI